MTLYVKGCSTRNFHADSTTVVFGTIPSTDKHLGENHQLTQSLATFLHGFFDDDLRNFLEFNQVHLVQDPCSYHAGKTHNSAALLN